MKMALLSLSIGAAGFFLPQIALGSQPANSHTATAPNPMIVAHRGSSAQAPEPVSMTFKTQSL
jgi:glycerophosphoryl diester phosphodiesterase